MILYKKHLTKADSMSAFLLTPSSAHLRACKHKSYSYDFANKYRDGVSAFSWANRGSAALSPQGRVLRLARAEPGKTRQRRFDLHKTLKNNETGWSKYENTDIKK